MNGDGAVVNAKGAIPMTADDKMKLVKQKFRVTGITTGLISGLTYGIYTTWCWWRGTMNPWPARWECWRLPMFVPV